MQYILDTFDQRLAYELALGFETVEKVYPRYGLSKDEWDKLRRTRDFRNLVEKYMAEMQKDGTSFRNKAGVLAEDLLYVAHSIASDVDNAPGVRMESLQWLAKVSGRDESNKKEVSTNAPPFMISINLGEQQQTMKILSPEPVEVERG